MSLPNQLVVSGAGTSGFNGTYILEPTPGGKPFSLVSGSRVWWKVNTGGNLLNGPLDSAIYLKPAGGNYKWTIAEMYDENSENDIGYFSAQLFTLANFPESPVDLEFESASGETPTPTIAAVGIENGWNSGEGIYYINWVATTLSSAGNGTWNGQTYLNGVIQNGGGQNGGGSGGSGGSGGGTVSAFVQIQGKAKFLGNVKFVG